jgi:hypothetical protein
VEVEGGVKEGAKEWAKQGPIVRAKEGVKEEEVKEEGGTGL